MQIRLDFQFGERGVHFVADSGDFMSHIDQADFDWLQGHLDDLSKTFFEVAYRFLADANKTIDEVNDELR